MGTIFFRWVLFYCDWGGEGRRGRFKDKNRNRKKKYGKLLCKQNIHWMWEDDRVVRQQQWNIKKKTSTTTKSNSFNLLWSIEIIPLSCHVFFVEDTHFLSLIFYDFSLNWKTIAIKQLLLFDSFFFFFLSVIPQLSWTYFSTHIHTQLPLCTLPSLAISHFLFFHNSSYFFHIIWNNEMWKSCCNFSFIFLFSFFPFFPIISAFQLLTSNTHTHNNFTLFLILFIVTVLQFVCLLIICKICVSIYLSLYRWNFFFTYSTSSQLCFFMFFLRVLSDNWKTNALFNLSAPCVTVWLLLHNQKLLWSSCSNQQQQQYLRVLCTCVCVIIHMRINCETKTSWKIFRRFFLFHFHIFSSQHFKGFVVFPFLSFFCFEIVHIIH